MSTPASFTGRTGTTITPGTEPGTEHAGYIDGKKIQGIVAASDGMYYDLGDDTYTVKVDTEYNAFLASLGEAPDARVPSATAPAAPAAPVAQPAATTTTPEPVAAPATPDKIAVAVHPSALAELEKLLRDLEAGVIADAHTVRNTARKLFGHFFG